MNEKHCRSINITGKKHCSSINDMSEKHCRNRNITNRKSSRNRNEMEGKSCSRIRKSCGKLWSLARKLETNCYKVAHKLEKVRRQAGKSLCKCAKKLRASQVQFRAMCRKSLYKSTENEEAGKVQSCANVRKCAQYLYKCTENCRKLMEKRTEMC